MAEDGTVASLSGCCLAENRNGAWGLRVRDASGARGLCMRGWAHEGRVHVVYWQPGWVGGMAGWFR
jgi:hypothetical protein